MGADLELSNAMGAQAVLYITEQPLNQILCIWGQLDLHQEGSLVRLH